MNESFTFDRYELSPPLWTIVNVSRLRSAGLIRALDVLDNAALPGCVPIFTEDEFGLRMIEAKELTGSVLLQLPTFHDLQQLLLNFMHLGGKHVVIDPTERANSPGYRQRAAIAKHLY